MNFIRHASAGTWGTCLSWCLSIFFAVLLGYFLGGISGTRSLQGDLTMRIVEDSGALVPTVNIRSWKSGSMEGLVQGEVRLLVDGTPVVPGQSGSFALGNPARQGASSGVPAGMQFVASKRGKKYYPVGSAGANNLSEANKIYFPDAAAAEAAGYVR